MKTKLNQSKLKLAIVSSIVAGTMGLSATSFAATATGTMAVSTAVSMSCTIEAAAMTFAAYDPTAATDNDATATITSTCTRGGAAVITMSQGGKAKAGSTEAIPLRAMWTGVEAAPKLGYFIYSGSVGGTVWGNTPATGKAITANGSAQTFTAFGRIPKEQTVGAGNFTDSVSVTLTY